MLRLNTAEKESRGRACPEVCASLNYRATAEANFLLCQSATQGKSAKVNKMIDIGITVVIP